jgi:hypothetical protein
MLPVAMLMPVHLKPMLAVVAAALAAVLPTTASATERFAAITARGELATFTSQAPAGSDRPRPVTGLLPGERLIALDATPGALWGVGSAARLYRIDLEARRATPIGGPFATGLRGARFSLAVTAAGDRGRLASDVGQDLLIDLASGEARNGPGLTTDRGRPVRPVIAFTPEDVLVGVDPAQRLALTARPTTATFAERPLRDVPRLLGRRLEDPAALALASDGRAFLSVSPAGARQSFLTTVDLSGGAVRLLDGAPPYLIAALTSLGRVADDATPPRVEVVAPRRVTLRSLLAQRVRVRLAADEGFLFEAGLRTGGRRARFVAVGSRFFAGSVSALLRLSAEDARRIRAARPRSAVLEFTVRDWAGNLTRRRTAIALAGRERAAAAP